MHSAWHVAWGRRRGRGRVIIMLLAWRISGVSQAYLRYLGVSQIISGTHISEISAYLRRISDIISGTHISEISAYLGVSQIISGTHVSEIRRGALSAVRHICTSMPPAIHFDLIRSLLHEPTCDAQ